MIYSIQFYYSYPIAGSYRVSYRLDVTHLANTEVIRFPRPNNVRRCLLDRLFLPFGHHSGMHRGGHYRRSARSENESADRRHTSVPLIHFDHYSMESLRSLCRSRYRWYRSGHSVRHLPDVHRRDRR